MIAKVDFIPPVVIEFFEYFWIEVIVGLLVLIFLLFGGFLYAYSDFPKTKISLMLANLLINSFSYLFIVSFFIGWNANFYVNYYFITFNNYYVFNTYTFFLKLWIIFFSILGIHISKNFLNHSKYNLVEYSVLIGFISFLLIILVSLIDLFAIFIVVESLFFLLMCLSVMKFSHVTVEACIKYFMQNVFISGLALLGLLMVYSVCKSTNVFVIKAVFVFQLLCDFENKTYVIFFLTAGLFLFFLTFLFKIGFVPYHFYAPDLYEASSYSVIFFFSCVVKPIFLLFFLKLFEYFILNFSFSFIFLFFISFFSVALGFLGAMQQFNIKRFLAYTSINQLGFLLFCFICNSGNWSYVFIYLFLYCIIQVPFFYIMSVVVDPMQYNTLSNFSDFNRITLFTGFRQAISISFFFVSGLPPFLLFVYKYIMLTQIAISGYFLVVLFIIILNAVALVYYLRIIKAMLFEEKNAISFTSSEYIIDDIKKNYNDTYNITVDFILYLFFALYISAYLFFYIDEIQNYLNGNYSENFLNLFYTLRY